MGIHSAPPWSVGWGGWASWQVPPSSSVTERCVMLGPTAMSSRDGASVVAFTSKGMMVPRTWLGWEFRFWIPISGTTGIRNSASENGIPELSGGKNPKIYGGNRFRHSKKKKKKAGTFFSENGIGKNRKNRLKKTTGIRNSAGISGIPIGFPNQGDDHV